MLEMLNGIPVIELAIRAYQERLKSAHVPTQKAAFVDGFEAGVRAARVSGPDPTRLLEAARNAIPVVGAGYTSAYVDLCDAVAEFEAAAKGGVS